MKSKIQILLLTLTTLFQIGCAGLGSGTIIVSDSTNSDLNGEYQLENIEARQTGVGTFIDCRDGCIENGQFSVTLDLAGGISSIYFGNVNGVGTLPYTCLELECENVEIDPSERTISFNETLLNESTTNNELKISGTISYPKPQLED